jgi:hypothetical protein
VILLISLGKQPNVAVVLWGHVANHTSIFNRSLCLRHVEAADLLIA